MTGGFVILDDPAVPKGLVAALNQYTPTKAAPKYLKDAWAAAHGKLTATLRVALDRVTATTACPGYLRTAWAGAQQ